VPAPLPFLPTLSAPAPAPAFVAVLPGALSLQPMPSPAPAPVFNSLTLSDSALTAHPRAQAVAVATVESAAPGSPPTACNDCSALQVRELVATADGVHLRFNQRVDLTRLLRASGENGTGSPATNATFVLLKDGVPVPGVLVPDPDGEGFVFIAQGGVLPPGDYRVLLRAAADGVLTPQGATLDGDFDGRAGGDYRARLSVPGSRPVVSLDTGEVGAGKLTVSDAQAEDAAALWLAAALPFALPLVLRRNASAAGDDVARVPPRWLATWLCQRKPASRLAVHNDWRIRL
jgi:hypothetical protein